LDARWQLIPILAQVHHLLPPGSVPASFCMQVTVSALSPDRSDCRTNELRRDRTSLHN
jgi:hypothetical protein